MTFREHLLRDGKSDATIRVYTYWVDRARRAGIDPDDPDAESLRRWVDDVFPMDKRATRVGIRWSLAAYWDFMGLTGPEWAVRIPKGCNEECRALEPAEDQAMVRAALADGGRRGLAVLLGLYLGLRCAEIAKLRWEQFRGDGWIRVVGKGSKLALLPVHPDLATALASYREGAPRSAWVFPGALGGRRPHVHEDTIRKWTDRVAEQADIGHVVPHRLRHSCLATAQDNSRDLRGTQKLARHSSPATTQRYTRVLKQQLVDVVMALRYEGD